MKSNRRAFLRMTGAAGAAAFVLTDNSIELVAQASRALGSRAADDVASDESYWREIQSAFTLDRSLINLNNGNSCPSPTVVHDAYKRYLDFSNQAPVYHRGMIERNIEEVRRRLADQFGCDTEEMAITRNSSESLQIAQNGLDLEPGDEVVTTEQDYGRMLTTWDQRARRNKIDDQEDQFPGADDRRRSLRPARGRDHAADQGAALLPHHEPDRPDLPGAEPRAHGALARHRHRSSTARTPSAHFPFKLRDLEMDYYGTSLHKWLLAPTGTGFLYVRSDRIAKTWPMQAAPERSDNDIRKFEEIGTSPAATKAAINEALAFHQAIGIERVAARLRYLTLRWANKLKANPRVQIHTGLDQVYGVACVGIKDIPASKINAFMWDKYRIITDGDQPPRIQRHPRHAEHLHAARGDRHVHDGDGGSAEERTAGDRVTPEQVRAAEEFKRLRGVEPFGPFVDLLISPELMTRVGAVGEYLRYRSALPPKLSEFAILVTAAAWQQQFEWDVHAPVARKAGIPQATLDELWSGATPLGLDRDQLALYDLCMELHRDRRVTAATRGRAVAALGEQGAMDAIGICGYYALLAMVLNARPRT